MLKYTYLFIISLVSCSDNINRYSYQSKNKKQNNKNPTWTNCVFWDRDRHYREHLLVNGYIRKEIKHLPNELTNLIIKKYSQLIAEEVRQQEMARKAFQEFMEQKKSKMIGGTNFFVC